MEEIEKKITLESGAELEITLAPFVDSRNLLKILTRDIKTIKLENTLDIRDVDLIKNVVCSALSSTALFDAIDLCMKRCTYKGMKVTKDTFEPEEARQDYLTACITVTKANVFPFVKGLLPELLVFLLGKKKKSE